jgi:hypothetical protein
MVDGKRSQTLPSTYCMHVASLADLKFSDVKMKYSHLQLGELARWVDKHQRDGRPISTSGSNFNVKHISNRPCSALLCRKFYLQQ